MNYSTLLFLDAMGTCVLFEEGQPKGQANDGPELKYRCHTVKKLMMQRIFLTEKKEGETSTGNDGSGDKEDTTLGGTDEHMGDKVEVEKAADWDVKPGIMTPYSGE